MLGSRDASLVNAPSSESNGPGDEEVAELMVREMNERNTIYDYSASCRVMFCPVSHYNAL